MSRAATGLAVASLVAVGLAGCGDPGQADFSKEALVMSIRPQAGPFEVGIPLWLAPGGATAHDWLAAVRGRGDLHVRLNDTDRGAALWVTGDAAVAFEAQDVVTPAAGCCARAYLRGDYSLGDHQGRPWVFTTSDVEVTWNYEGSSLGCSLFINHFLLRPQPGWNVMAGGGRSPPPDCTDI